MDWQGRVNVNEAFIQPLFQFATEPFFVVDEEVMSDDIAFLADRLDCRVSDALVSKHTRQMHVSWVLNLFGYRQLDDRSRLDLEARALEAARISSSPVYVLRDLVDYSALLSTLDKQSNNTAIDTLQRVTPLARQHINFYGKYRFDSDLRRINLAALAQNLAKTDSKKWGMVA